MSHIELRGVTKRFGGSKRPAVREVDLEVAGSERFVIVGPSGSGKTTTLRLIAGLDRPDAGTIRIGGASVDGVAPRHRGVGMVFQNPALYPHLTVRDNLAFGLQARHEPASLIAARIAELAGWLDLGDLLDRHPRGLSGGEIQRVAIGRAVATRPRVLLLDEPFSGLDAPLRAATRATLIDLHRKIGGSLVLVTHDQAEAMTVGDRLAVMSEGRVVQVGTPEELYRRPIDRFVAGFLGEPAMSLLACFVDESGRVRTDAGATLGLAPPMIRGRAIYLGLRPEDVQFAVEGPVRAVLDRIEPRGYESIARFRLGDQRLSARVGAGFDRPIGEEAALGLDMDRAHWFEQGGDQRRIDITAPTGAP